MRRITRDAPPAPDPGPPAPEVHPGPGETEPVGPRFDPELAELARAWGRPPALPRPAAPPLAATRPGPTVQFDLD
jgi:hypothetical protein